MRISYKGATNDYPYRIAEVAFSEKEWGKIHDALNRLEHDGWTSSVVGEWACIEVDGYTEYKEVASRLREYTSPTISYAKFMELARKHYNKGGDGYWECWDRKTFKEYTSLFGAITYRGALKMFAISYDIEQDRIGW